ncbi:hypothetical protein [Acidihalobacter ferrooxydans]|uniref:Uncharacterized protein n=1 Tax=Acidihalobacter ferrooxydans TaxID=1765967 RepID=A0A1P8UHW9_9GAMM|nr:hypothetical protein [Acidihalobacter ferrooxydans]APZ43417.1 hypothetical protein BW247_10210 [Acidihalobacter ferrooxydans]
MSKALSQVAFTQQVERLFDEHGAATFAAPRGHLPQVTLFVEDDTVIAESAQSPRHRYGVFCELDAPLTDAALDAHVRQWLHSGTAYELFISMNVCRYNC